MGISLQLTARDGATLTEVAGTTATWTARGDELVGGCLNFKERKRRKLIHREVVGKPTEGHNSPDAMLQIVAEEVAAWYAAAIMPQPMIVEPRPRNHSDRSLSNDAGQFFQDFICYGDRTGVGEKPR